MLTTSETDDVLKIIGKLSAKHGWESYTRRCEAIRARIAAHIPPTLPPMPAGSLDNFTPCDACDCPKTCSRFDSCGRGR
jgi:hypothetical protein